MPNNQIKDSNLESYNFNLPKKPKTLSGRLKQLVKQPKFILGLVGGVFLVVALSLALLQTKENTDNRSQASGNTAALSWATSELEYTPKFAPPQDPAIPRHPVIPRHPAIPKDFAISQKGAISEAGKNICIKLNNPSQVVGLSAEVTFNPDLGFVEVIPNLNAGTVRQASMWRQSPNKDRVRFFIGVKPQEPLISDNKCIATINAWVRNQAGSEENPVAPEKFEITLTNFQVVHRTNGVQTGIISEPKSITLKSRPTNSTNTPTPVHDGIITLPPTKTPTVIPEPTEVQAAECVTPAPLGSLISRVSGSNIIFRWNAGACNDAISQDKAYVWWQVIDTSTDNKERVASSWSLAGSNVDTNLVTVDCSNRSGHTLRMDAFVSEVGKGFMSYAELQDKATRLKIVKSTKAKCP